MAVLRPLLIRAATLVGVFFAVLLILVITLGATGFSDRTLHAVVSEQIRGMRPGLAQTIRDPDELERTLQERRMEMEAFYGLDRPWHLRLPDTIGRVLTLDLGESRTLRSFDGSNKIGDIVRERVGNTVALLLASFVITSVVGLIGGGYLAAHPGAVLDRVTAQVAAASVALPACWLDILLILVLGVNLRIFPSGGMYSAPPPTEPFLRFLDLMWHAVLPTLTLVLVSVGPFIFGVRTMTINVAQEDHVMIARAKGVPEGMVLRRHILRVAAPPIVTSLIFGLTSTLGGAILTETVFNWQGMGRLYYDTIAGTPDEGVIVALTVIFTLIYVITRLVLEVLYVFLDPRVRYSGS